MQNPKSRDPSLDLIRSLAIVLVILCHATERVYIVWGGAPGNAMPGSIGYAVPHLLSRLGVPFFLMLTGALVLGGRFRSNDDVIDFYRTRLLPLFLSTEAWVVLYNIGFAVLGRFTAGGLVADLLFIEYPRIHFWYMPMILGLYVAMPCVAIVAQRVSLRALALPLAITFLLGSVWPTAGWLYGHLGLGALPSTRLTLSFSGGLYGAYLIAGFQLYRRGAARRVPAAVLILVAFVGAAGAFAFEYGTGSYFYENPFLALSAVPAFELLLRTRDGFCAPALARACRFLAVNAFGVYLLHMAFIDLLPSAWFSALPGKPIQVMALIAVTMAASYLIVSVIGLVKPIARLLLNRR